MRLTPCGKRAASKIAHTKRLFCRAAGAVGALNCRAAAQPIIWRRTYVWARTRGVPGQRKRPQFGCVPLKHKAASKRVATIALWPDVWPMLR